MDGSQPSSTATSLKHRRPALLALTLLVPFLGACSVAAVLSALTPNGGAVIERDIVFDPANELRLDIYRPDPTNQQNALQPVVIFFYGGSWNSGDRATYAFC